MPVNIQNVPSKWDKIVSILNKHKVPFNETARKNKIHVAKDELPDEAAAEIQKAGGRMASIYNPKMVKRPAYIQHEPDAVQLTPADNTSFGLRGEFDELTAPYEKRQLETDSLAVGFAREIGDALRRHGSGPRRASDSELYMLEGDIQGGGAATAPRGLSNRFMNDAEFRQDVLDRIYHTLKASGAHKDADALIRNVKARYGIDYEPQYNDILQNFGDRAEVLDVQGISVPYKLHGDLYNEHNPTWYKTTYKDESGTHTRVRPWPTPEGLNSPDAEVRNKLHDISVRKASELPAPYAPATELTDEAAIAEHAWYPMQGSYAHPLGFISEDGKYFVSTETGLPLNFRHYRIGEGPYKLK